MKLPFALVAALLAVVPAARAADADGCRDHPLVSRIPGYELRQCEVNDYGEAEFRLKGRDPKVVGGRKWLLTYGLPEGGKGVSELFLARNYVNALKKVGATLEFFDERSGLPSLSLKKGGQEVWVSVSGYTGDGTPEAMGAYVVTIIEKGEMAQVVTATDILEDLRRTGRAVLYVQFDTAKDTIKPESAPLVAAMADLLKRDAALKVYVVGHTDSQGPLEDNLKLSAARAASVVKALTGQHGVAAARLQAQGVGELAPIASNDTEEGRKLNRRVELVKQ